MSEIHTDRSDVLVDRIVSSAFPGYKGSTVSLVAADSVELQGTAWGGGSRSSYAVVSVCGSQVVALPQYAPTEFGGPQKTPVVDLNPIGQASDAGAPFIVEHSLYRGKDMGIRIYAHPSRLTPLLPEGTKLTDQERLMLYITKCLKSFARRDEWARSQPADTFDAMREALAGRGLMRKNGSITNEGRNAVGDWHPPRGSGF